LLTLLNRSRAGSASAHAADFSPHGGWPSGCPMSCSHCSCSDWYWRSTCSCSSRHPDRLRSTPSLFIEEKRDRKAVEHLVARLGHDLVYDLDPWVRRQPSGDLLAELIALLRHG